MSEEAYVETKQQIGGACEIVRAVINLYAKGLEKKNDRESK